jgi:hypothetical protein
LGLRDVWSLAAVVLLVYIEADERQLPVEIEMPAKRSGLHISRVFGERRIANGEQRFFLDHNLRIYAWFLLLVTVLPAAARLFRPRELAKILLIRYQDPGRRKRARIGGYLFLAISLIAMPFAIRAPRGESTWLIIALLVGAVSSLEFVLDTRLFDEEPLTRQNRYFGGVYASIAIANLLLLTAR